MINKVCLVTGATSGIGKVIALELAKKGADIGIIARSEEKAEKTVNSIIRRSGNNQIKSFIADFSDLDQVRKAALQINQHYQHIDVLVNNAGIILSDKREVSKEGYELTLTINHLSPFLLTALLFEKLKKSNEARIINTSSVAHSFARPDLKDIHLKKSYSSFKAYGNSKLYNLMFTKELTKRLSIFPHITTSAYHPGIIGSNFSQNSGGVLGMFYKLASPFLPGNEKGAETGIFLASAPEALRYNGKYVINKKITTPSKKYLTDEYCKWLWEISEELTHQKFLNSYDFEMSGKRV